MNVNIARRCLTEKEAAAYIGMSRSFLRQDRMYSAKLGRKPKLPYIKIGRNVRYWQNDLDLCISQCRVGSHINETNE